MRFRSSGHETFPCRYTWIPKAFSALNENPEIFSDESRAMVRLGLGKNMVRSLRFWVQAMGVASSLEAPGRGLELTSFGRAVFDPEEGWDPYLEEVQTLWLLHWNIATQQDPLLAWDHLLFRHPNTEITRSTVVDQLLKRVEASEQRASQVTISQHFDIFLHTYVPTSGRKGEVLEDNLDCPLTELSLLQHAGQSRSEDGKREPVYAFRHEEKPEISSGLFLYCLQQFWDDSYSKEQTLSLREIATADRSPGKVFKLPEADIRLRLENIERDSWGYFTYVESVALQQVQRQQSQAPDFLPSVYGAEVMDV